jgi:hypothetical protein
MEGEKNFSREILQISGIIFKYSGIFECEPLWLKRGRLPKGCTFLDHLFSLRFYLPNTSLSLFFRDAITAWTYEHDLKERQEKTDDFL